jgi:hypothetical protein
MTSVVFLEDGAVISAKYKGHLASSFSNASGSNTQRKLVKWGANHYLVYQSAGRVWYLTSTNYGATWSNEQELPIPVGYESYQYTNPSLDVDGLGTAYVAYETLVDGTHRALFLEKKTTSGWTSVLGIPFTYLASAELKPVIAHTKSISTPKLTVVLKADGFASSDPGLHFVHIPSTGPVQVGKVSGTSSASNTPTLAAFNLAYKEGNAIYRSRIDYGPPITFGTRQLVSTNSYNGRLLSNITNPSVAVREPAGYDESIRPVIAWQATDLVFSTYRPIFVHHPVSGGGDIPVFVTTVFDWMSLNAHGRRPTVNVYQTGPGIQNPDVSIVWQDDPTDANGSYPNVMVANKISGNWSAQAILSTGTASSSVAQGDVEQSVSGGALVVWTGANGPPFPLTASQRTNSQIPNGPLLAGGATPFDYARGFDVNLGILGIEGVEGSLSIHVNQTEGATLRQFSELPSIREDFIRLEVQSTDTVSIPYTFSLVDAAIPRLTPEQRRRVVLSLQFSVDDTSYQTLRTISLNDLYLLWDHRSRDGDSSRFAQQRDAFRVPSVGEARFHLASEFLTDLDNVALFETITLTDSSARVAKHSAQPSQGPLPSVIVLKTNYPNPFNPSTTIEYGLPQDTYVRLEVFNVLGERVNVLTDGVQDAGYHSVVFDARGLPSGIYFYRLQAGDFVDTKKLILMK